MSNSIIFHIDVNSAFLSWEASYRVSVLDDPIDLRTLPSAVGGNSEERKGIILAKSIPTKPFGVQTGESIFSARQKCPDLIIVPPNYKLYEQCSKAFMAILRQYSPLVEQYSIDEAFMDMTGTAGLFGDPVAIAHTIKTQIHDTLGFTVNIGISSNKILAKMASDFKKPNRVHTLFPEEIAKKMWPLPVRDLFFVGRASEEKLRRLGIKTIGQLASANPTLLKQHLHKHGLILHAYANGQDVSPVIAKREKNKGYGNSMTIAYDVTSRQDAYRYLLSLSESIGARLRADEARARCLRISLVDPLFYHSGHQKMLLSATNSTHDLYLMACKTFDEIWDGVTPIRHIGVHTSKIEYGAGYQYNLFETNRPERYNKLDQAVDAIRERFGDDAIMRATFVDTKTPHMAGGIHGNRKSGIIHPT